MSFSRVARRFFGPLSSLWRLIWWVIRFVYFSCIHSIEDFMERPFPVTKAVVWDLLRHSVLAVLGAVGGVLCRFFRTRTLLDWWLFLRTIVVVLGLYYLFFSCIDDQIEPIQETDRTLVYSDQGWGKGADSDNRQTFYYTPQGANLLNIRYAWFVRLERPWKKERFALPQYMRAYGFIVDPERTAKNPDQLPIGLTGRWDQAMGEMALDITCAACHTGQIEMNTGSAKYAFRIDGGQAMHDLTGARPAHFIGDLEFSLIATVINPAKWNRFCTSTVRNGGYSFHCALPFSDVLKLYHGLWKVIWRLGKQFAIEQCLHRSPAQEGFGRTDALDRIANNTFAYNLHKMSNYRVASAPVSYPPLWDTWKLDYVQYVGSVKQPMARNVGESLGSGATYHLTDEYQQPVPNRERYVTSTAIANLNRIEGALRDLTPPQWPENIFPTDKKKADAGKALFLEHCWKCHGPIYADHHQMMIDAPLKQSIEQHWITRPQPLEVIGTDKTSVLNFVNYRFDLGLTGITSKDIRELLQPVYEEDYRRSCEPKPKCEKDADQQANYIEEQLNSVTPNSVSTGQGLQYIIGFIRQRAYKDMGLSDGNILPPYSCKPQTIVTTKTDLTALKQIIICDLDGFGQLDIPRLKTQYRPRPLMGIWATPPFLHNGSVPTLYALLSPAYERPPTFSVKSRYFDTVHVGLDDDGTEKNAFTFDTRIPGNLNVGHEFRAGYREDHPQEGVIGPELTPEKRFEIIEFMKTMNECDFKEINCVRGKEYCPGDPEYCPANSEKKADKAGFR